MDFYLFDRKDVIRHFEDLSILNGKKKISDCEELVMSENEKFVFQIAVLPKENCTVSKISCSSEADVFCVNTDIVDKFGKKGKKSIELKNNEIQPLFFVADASGRAGCRLECKISIVTDKGKYSFSVYFSVNDEAVKNYGYNDIWSLSRLNWLNSDLFIDDTVPKPFESPQLNGRTASVIGREFEFSASGLPVQIHSKFDEAVQVTDKVQKSLFYKKAEFVINGSCVPDGKTDSNAYNNRIESVTACENDDYTARISSTLRYEGMIEYSVEITPKRDFISDDVALSFFVAPENSVLMHGLGKRAVKAESFTTKWDNQKQQDSLFIGSVNCGMRIKWKAENYIRPLVNIFYKNLPLAVPKETWDNYGKGKISVSTSEQGTQICASTGSFEFKKGEARHFDFEIHSTPLKAIDYKKAFSVRYSHSNELRDEIKEINEAAEKGLTHVIFHQGNMIMPFINYPFYETERLKNAVDYAAKKNIGIKLYYTEREHSNHMAETFVYKALGDEIILRKKGVSHSWQKEKPQWLIDNFGEDIIPGWFVKYKHGKYKNDHDISFIVKPDTRLDNYYVEGLNWLVQNIGIKGIYIDDTSLDRTTLERARKVLQQTDGLIDMHMWNHEEVRAGDVSCMNLYTEILPYLDSVWLGEGFFYKKYSPEYMLAEVSGIPYGLTGQMLEGGGDFHAGMLYGMNNRYGWGYKNAVHMYKVWDDFGITESRMLGYWHRENPASTDNKNVLATVYLKEDKALICLYNFSFKREKFRLKLDKSLLTFDISESRKIKFGKDSKRRINIDKTFSLGKRKGIILEISK